MTKQYTVKINGVTVPKLSWAYAEPGMIVSNEPIPGVEPNECSIDPSGRQRFVYRGDVEVAERA